jgi:hypothetical protein
MAGRQLLQRRARDLYRRPIEQIVWTAVPEEQAEAAAC